MSLGRRKIKLSDSQAWVFNRMAAAYDARPPYPAALIDALVELASPSAGSRTEDPGAPAARVLDLGAGIGHVALPLAARGLAVTAVEPAREMLERLRAAARERGLPVQALHAQAEALPVAAASAELVVISDALHFLDAELTAREVARVLAARGALAVVTCEFASTPFMDALVALMHESAPRRLRAIEGPLVQLSAVSGVALSAPIEIVDLTPVDGERLVRILQTISFLGPAMNPARFAAFRERACALPEPAWARRFTLRSGRKQ
jgi:ubiquinone/menaquinone biosynthesis C-methylase UbiE